MSSKITVFTTVGLLLLMLSIHMVFKGSFGAESVGAFARGDVAHNGFTFPMYILQVPC